MRTPEPPVTTVDRLLEAYDGLLLDAFGVLVDKSGPLPGAPALIERLNARDKPYYILTNSASRLPQTYELEFGQWGFTIPAERFITSGMLLTPYFAEHDLCGARTVVLGPDDSLRYAEQAGAELVALEATMDAEVVVMADQKGFDALAGMDATISMIMRRVDAGRPVHLLLSNPDLIYPLAPGHYGFTAGGLAAMIDAVLAQRYPDRGLGFIPLGKPHAPIFEEAVRRAGTRHLAMLGDQLATDILGARRFGIDAILVGTGLSSSRSSRDVVPDFFLPSLLE